MNRLGILISGRGSNFEAIADSIDAGRLEAEIAIVISNKSECRGSCDGLSSEGSRRLCVHSRAMEREAYDRLVVEKLREARVDLVCLAGFMRLLSAYFVGEFPQRILNIHPSLLPAFPGLEAQLQALEHGVKHSRCTVHFVDEKLDAGPIISQATVPVLDSDDEGALAARILSEEHRIYTEAIRLGPKRQIPYRWTARVANAMTIEQQIEYLRKGCAEVISEAELAAKLKGLCQAGASTAGQGGI